MAIKCGLFRRWTVLAGLAGLAVLGSSGQAQTTAFTYQGQLNQDGAPVNGFFDLKFSLYGVNTGGTSLNGAITNLDVSVTNGLFTTMLDFGATPFTGSQIWLQIGVRTNGGGAFSPLSPRQDLSPAPYAIYSASAGTAATAGTAGTAGFATTAGTAQAVAAGSVSAGDLNMGSVSGALDSYFWSLGGNSGTGGSAILGTTDNQPLQLFTAGNPQLTITSGGNVGIGTTTPTDSLEVNGTVRLDNNPLYLRGSGDQNHFLAYRQSVAGTYVDGPFLAGWNGGALGGKSPETISLAWDWQGNAWVSNNLATTQLNIDRLDQNGGSVATNALTFGADSGEGIASKRTGNTWDLEFYTAYSNRMTIANSGNVSISGALTVGAINASALTVTGNVQIDNQQLLLSPVNANGNGLEYTTGLPNVPLGAGPFLFGYLGGALGTVQPTEINLSWDSGGNVWVRENLTIGANTATASLEVGANTATASLNVDPGNANANGAIGGDALTFGSNSGEGISSKRSSGGYNLEFYTDFANRVTIAQDGNVGVGTTSPGSLLEVNGDVRLDNNRLNLTSGGDVDNGLQYLTGLPFVPGGAGPMLYGFNGGSLGSLGPTEINLSWDYSGNVWVRENLSTATLTIRGGSDVAEPFPVTGSTAEAGTVMVIDKAHPGHLIPSTQPYDTRVAGIISGAGGVNPGLELHQDGVLDEGQKVALTGRVYVRADATHGEIEPGDLLTTAGTPGCAMKVTDHARAQGAILGKAMTGLKDGNGLVLVLVTLQ